MEILGVVNVVPVPNEAPPVISAYQFIVPTLVVAPKVRVPASHLEAGVVEEIVGIGLTVIVPVAVFVPPVQPPVMVMV